MGKLQEICEKNFMANKKGMGSEWRNIQAALCIEYMLSPL